MGQLDREKPTFSSDSGSLPGKNREPGLFMFPHSLDQAAFGVI
jgi:hypothetical protein